jgi:hypothetical protein
MKCPLCETETETPKPNRVTHCKHCRERIINFGDNPPTGWWHHARSTNDIYKECHRTFAEPE